MISAVIFTSAKLFIRLTLFSVTKCGFPYIYCLRYFARIHIPVSPAYFPSLRSVRTSDRAACRSISITPGSFTPPIVDGSLVLIFFLLDRIELFGDVGWFSCRNRADKGLGNRLVSVIIVGVGRESVKASACILGVNAILFESPEILGYS